MQKQREKEFELNAQQNRRADLEMIAKLRKNENKLKKEIEDWRNQNSILNKSWEKRFYSLKNRLDMFFAFMLGHGEPSQTKLRKIWSTSRMA